MKRNGFTLPELIVSLAIVALLIAAVGSNLVTYGERQRARELEAHQQLMLDALEQCLALEGRYPDPAVDLPLPVTYPVSKDINDLPTIRDHLKTNYHAIFTGTYEYVYNYSDATHASITITVAP